MEVGTKTNVTTTASAFDPKTLPAGGCDPVGCTAELSRDSDIDPSSRWSCQYGLAGAPCEIWYTWEEAQYIIEMRLAFYKGDERTRAFTVKIFDGDDIELNSYDYTSSGGTLEHELFAVDGPDVSKVMITPAEPNVFDWFSVTEVSRPSS